MSSNFKDVADFKRAGYADVSKRLVDMMMPHENVLPALQVLRIDLRYFFRNGFRAFHELVDEQEGII